VCTRPVRCGSSRCAGPPRKAWTGHPGRLPAGPAGPGLRSRHPGRAGPATGGQPAPIPDTDVRLSKNLGLPQDHFQGYAHDRSSIWFC
jgi:hypothetical protein